MIEPCTRILAIYLLSGVKKTAPLRIIVLRHFNSIPFFLPRRSRRNLSPSSGRSSCGRAKTAAARQRFVRAAPLDQPAAGLANQNPRHALAPNRHYARTMRSRAANTVSTGLASNPPEEGAQRRTSPVRSDLCRSCTSWRLGRIDPLLSRPEMTTRGRRTSFPPDFPEV